MLVSSDVQIHRSISHAGAQISLREIDDLILLYKLNKTNRAAPQAYCCWTFYLPQDGIVFDAPDVLNIIPKQSE